MMFKVMFDDAKGLAMNLLTIKNLCINILNKCFMMSKVVFDDG